MTEEQLCRYRTWLREGTAWLQAMGEGRPGWYWLMMVKGGKEEPVRAFGPTNFKKLMEERRG